MTKKYSLGKKERLKSRKQIDALFSTGRKVSLFPFRILYTEEEGDGSLQAAFSVSSKNFPLAVERNRIKRLCRELYRKGNHSLADLAEKNKKSLYLFILYTGKEILPAKEMSLPFRQLMEKVEKQLHERSSQNM